ncbi:MAG: hypothetical protein R2881_07920 [Eubacteriales bacterium]
MPTGWSSTRTNESSFEHSVLEMERETGFDRNEALADMRYTFIEGRRRNFGRQVLREPRTQAERQHR